MATGVAGSTADVVGAAHPVRGLALAGLVAALAAAVATTAAAALAGVAGVELEVPDGGEIVPLSGVAVLTGFFSLLGAALAMALLRWSARPAQRFLRAALLLTVLSLVPPLLAGADAAATATLVGLHLVAAAVVVPALTAQLRRRTG